MAYDFYAPKPLLASELRRFLKQLRDQHKGVNGWPADISSRLGESMLAGKMVRGLLVSYAYAASGGKKPSVAIKAGTAIETLHAALLIHDDVMDGDRLRRGRPSLFANYEEALKRRNADQAAGKNLAICVGDALYFQAFNMLASLSGSSLFASRAVELIAAELAKVTCAQMEDIYLAADPAARLSEQRILSLYRHKTARYTFSLPLMIGALLAAAPESLLKQYALLGEQLGIIFQIKDDELGLLGSETETGKPVGSDIREGKKTLYYMYLYERADDEDKKSLDEAFGAVEIDEKKISSIRSLIEKYDIQRDINRLIDSYSSSVEKDIARLPIGADFKATLFDLYRTNLKRRS